MPTEQLSDKSRASKNASLLVAALNHSRDAMSCAVNVRQKNFHFFVILVGFLAAGYANLSSPWQGLVLPITGIVLSILFFLLDVRGSQLLHRSNTLLNEIERVVWKEAGLKEIPESHQYSRLRLVSHAFLYRAFFAIVGLASAARLLVEIARLD